MSSPFDQVIISEGGGELDENELSLLETLDHVLNRGLVIAGEITMNRVAGAVVVRGGSGASTLATISGTLDASAVSGRITVGERANGAAPTAALDATIETVGGEVNIFGRWHADTRLRIATHDGPITITPIAAALPRVETTMAGATVPQALRTANGAGGLITVRSFKGKLNVVPVGGI